MQTGDGYLLGLHRLAWRKGEEDVKVNHGSGSIRKNVVYMHHGLMMNSEVWVCLTDEERCLPFRLVEKGYDVWVSSLRLRGAMMAVLTKHSLETIAETSTPRNQSILRLPIFLFGTSPWMNLRSTISQIAFSTSFLPRQHPRFLTSAFLKVQRRPLRLLLFTQNSTIRSMSLSPSLLRCHQLACRTGLSML